MKKYYGTVKITLNGFFEADGEKEILDDPLKCISNCTLETEIVDIEEDDDYTYDDCEEDDWEEDDDWEE